ncbi:MAG: 5-formyltetrahydrofolate cyclo-ligase [Nanoarchaeota archaeon]|mgnify:CR=1 FL=1
MKTFLRKSILEKRNALLQKDVISNSNRIKERLFKRKEFINANCVMFYVSFGHEVNTHEMIKDSLNKKFVLVPKIFGNDIKPCKLKDFSDLSLNKHKILEPISSIDVFNGVIDLIIVPGIAFDLRGYRIGYGKGYYDRFLKTRNTLKIGLAFELQIIKEIPIHNNDVAIDMIISERRFILCED